MLEFNVIAFIGIVSIVMIVMIVLKALLKDTSSEGRGILSEDTSSEGRGILSLADYNPELPPAKDKIVAGILGILLGSIGIHSFYLGYAQRGIIQIVVTLVTLGIGGIWGFIEGILILVTEDWTDSEGRALKGQARASTSSMTSTPRDYIDELKGLKELLDSGVISTEEFEEKKKKLL